MKKFLSVCFLSGVICLATYPFVWMFLSCFKTNREIYRPGQLLPGSFDGSSFRLLLDASYLPFMKIFSNSLLASIGQATLATLVSAGAGFCLAKYRFRGNSLIFGLAVLIILMPKQTFAVPLFEWMSWLGLRGSLWSLLLPGAVSGMGVVFFYQIFRHFPEEWIELSRMEGLSPLRTFWVIFPLVLPGVLAFFLLYFVLCFQEHLLPMLLLDDENATLPLALAKLKDSSHRIPESVGMAASTLSIVPLLLVFAMAFRKLRSALRLVSLS